MAVQTALLLSPPGTQWERTNKYDADCARLADGHYSRRTIGSPQFMPPGQTIVLVSPARDAVWGWWRPDPNAGITAMNGLDGWTCTLFRNTGPVRSSELVLAAERALVADGRGCGPDGMITYVWCKRVASPNPGYCYQVAGWKKTGWSADGKKRLLQKPYTLAGVQP